MHAGFDLCRFPGNLRAVRFDVERFAAHLAAQVSGTVDGVASHHEQYGVFAAALVAEALALPGTAPAAVLACQHKHWCRQVLDRVAPDANPPYRLLRASARSLAAIDLPPPWFVRPVRGTFSILARRVDDLAELATHRRRGWLERRLITALVASFDASTRTRLGTDVGACDLLVEPLCPWPQFNLDGYMFDGVAHAIGVSDELMYPGTRAFVQFAYPSRLPAAAQAHALAIAERFLRAVGFTHGLFNFEFFHDPATGAIRAIEFNPRLGSQLADLYRHVDGIDPHAIAIELALGRDPARLPRSTQNGGVAASFVFRIFEGTRPRPPGAMAQARLIALFPDALFFAFPARGPALRRELRWLGSHRYGTLNLHGHDDADLWRSYAIACALLGWPEQPRPTRPQDFPMNSSRSTRSSSSP